jgi:hypothetical protein
VALPAAKALLELSADGGDPYDANGGGIWGALGVETAIGPGPLYPFYRLAVATGTARAAARPYVDAYTTNGGGLSGAIAVGNQLLPTSNAISAQGARAMARSRSAV